MKIFARIGLTHFSPMLRLYRSQFIDLHCKVVDLFIYNRNTGLKWVDPFRVCVLYFFKNFCYPVMLPGIPKNNSNWSSPNFAFDNNLSCPDPGPREKINFNFYCHISLGCLKMFYEGLKTFLGTTKKYENRNLS